MNEQEGPIRKLNLIWQRKTRGQNSQNSFLTRTKINSMFKQALMKRFKISAEVFFNESAGSSVSVFGSVTKYWSQQMKNALGLAVIEGFPFQLSPLKTKTALPSSQNLRQALPKSSIKRIESTQRQTNFSLQIFETYFNKPGSRTQHRLKQKHG